MEQSSDTQKSPEWYIPQWFIGINPQGTSTGIGPDGLERRGPFSLEQIEDLLRKGQIKPHYKVGRGDERELRYTVLEILQPYLDPTNTLFEALQAAKNRRTSPETSYRRNPANSRPTSAPATTQRRESNRPPFLQKVIFFIGALFLFLFSLVFSVCAFRLFFPKDGSQESVEQPDTQVEAVETIQKPSAVPPPPPPASIPQNPTRKETSPSQLRSRKETTPAPPSVPAPAQSVSLTPPSVPLTPLSSRIRRTAPNDEATPLNSGEAHPEDTLEGSAPLDNIPPPPDLVNPAEDAASTPPNPAATAATIPIEELSSE